MKQYSHSIKSPGFVYGDSPLRSSLLGRTALLFAGLLSLAILSSCASLVDSVISKTFDATEKKVVKTAKKESPSVSAMGVEPTKENVIAAIKANDFDTLKGLLRKVDDVKTITGPDALLLHMAEKAWGSGLYTSPSVELLVEKKAYTMQYDEKGRSWGEYVETLFEDPSMVGCPRWEYVFSINNERYEKMHKALKEDNVAIVKELEPYGFLPRPNHLSSAVDYEALDIIRYMLSKGVPPVYKSPRSGFDLLHIPCSDFPFEEQEPVVALLIEAGADVNAQDRKGHTPLYQILYSSYSFGKRAGSPVKIASMLLDAGCDTTHPDLPALATILHEYELLDRILEGNPGWKRQDTTYFFVPDEKCRAVFAKHGINPDK